jgi:tyrosyl-tRNA synthetase
VGMSIAESFAVLESILGDCINKEELHLLLNKNPSPVCYVWFVPSPSMHITQVWRYKVSTPFLDTVF